VSAKEDVTEQSLSLHSRASEETRRVAAGLARAWLATTEGAGLVLSLTGPLGAGKTVFVKGLGEGLEIGADLVSSPTFVIANQYPGANGNALHHVDFYRIEEAAELEDMGFFDLIAPGALLAVEWGERFENALPHERIEVRISPEGEVERRIDVTARGDGPCAVLAAWRGGPATARR